MPAAPVPPVVDDPRARGVVEGELRKRYGADYEVICAGSGDDRPLQRPPMLLESSLPGVFAAGDIRSGSVKRVASAVGEGSTAIRLIHDYLRDA
jgi:hypothetical protein